MQCRIVTALHIVYRAQIGIRRWRELMFFQRTTVTIVTIFRVVLVFIDIDHSYLSVPLPNQIFCNTLCTCKVVYINAAYFRQVGMAKQNYRTIPFTGISIKLVDFITK